MKRGFHNADLGSPSWNGTEVSGDTQIKSKSRACSECKKHKIKCQIDTGLQKCRRCLRQDLNCVTDNTLQKFVDGDAKWKESAKLQTSRLEAAVSGVLRHLSLPALDSYGTDFVGSNGTAQSPNVGPNGHAAQAISSRYGTLDIPSIDVTREASQEPNFEESSVVSAPTEALYEVTRLRNLRGNRIGDRRPKSNLLETDLVSRGVLSLDEATSLFESFHRTMNQLLWGGIILKHSTLESVRRSSSLLLAAILTVASIHIANDGEALEKCHDEYVSLVSRSVLKRSYSLDDIRALCVGAFWLPDLSWQLSGHAVRLATGIGLHHSLQKMAKGDPSYHERAQLWFLLYVCDHQFATMYGRPPTVHEDAAITGYETFLQHPTTTPGDVRLMAQVALFIIYTHIYHCFGASNDQPIVEDDFPEIRRYNLELDRWRTIWQPRSADSQYVHTYPSKGVILHYYFAKFQLNSLALRAISPETSSPLSTARKESANIAISSAMSTLAFILDEADVRNNIIGIPLFTHTMLAFSAVFLLKVTLKWSAGGGGTSNPLVRAASKTSSSSSSAAARTTGIYINVDAVEDLVERVISLLHDAVANEKHLTRHIARGLSKLLASFRTAMRGELQLLQQQHDDDPIVHEGRRHSKQVTVPPPPAASQQKGYPYANVNVGDGFEMPDMSSVSEMSGAACTPVDHVGFSFDEIWQNFPATTLDFLTSQWQE